MKDTDDFGVKISYWIFYGCMNCYRSNLNS